MLYSVSRSSGSRPAALTRRLTRRGEARTRAGRRARAGAVAARSCAARGRDARPCPSGVDLSLLVARLLDVTLVDHPRCAQSLKRTVAASSRSISFCWVTNCCCWRCSSSSRASVFRRVVPRPHADPAAVQLRDLADGLIEQVAVVRDGDGGAVEAGEQALEPRASDCVEMRLGLVEQQHVRILGPSPRRSSTSCITKASPAPAHCSTSRSRKASSRNRGSWLSYKGGQLAQGRDAAKEVLKTDTALYDELFAAVQAKLERRGSQVGADFRKRHGLRGAAILVSWPAVPVRAERFDFVAARIAAMPAGRAEVRA